VRQKWPEKKKYKLKKFVFHSGIIIAVYEKEGKQIEVGRLRTFVTELMSIARTRSFLIPRYV